MSIIEKEEILEDLKSTTLTVKAFMYGAFVLVMVGVSYDLFFNLPDTIGIVLIKLVDEVTSLFFLLFNLI